MQYIETDGKRVYILGYVVYQGNQKLFFQRPDHATYLIEQAIKRTPLNCAMHKEGDITVVPAKSYPECAVWVTIYEIAKHQVWASMWSPESPNKLEEDHDKVKRFNVDRFHWTKEEAQARAEAFAEKHNYKLM